MTDQIGKSHKFHVSSNAGASSSIYEFALHRDIWPEVTFTHDIDIISSTLDQVMIDKNIDPKSMNALVMDTQGSELLVLKGAGKVLEQVRYIKTEAADFESYVGCTTVVELSDYLSRRGFELIAQEPFADHPAGGRYYELLYKRRVRSWIFWIEFCLRSVRNYF